MKTLVTLLATAAALTVAIAASGFDFDATVVVSIAFVSVIAALFVNDYGRATRYNLDAAKTPVRVAKKARRVEAGTEFATLATFNTMVG